MKQEIEMVRVFYKNGTGNCIAVRRNLKARWYHYTPWRFIRLSNACRSAEKWPTTYQKNVITMRRGG